MDRVECSKLAVGKAYKDSQEREKAGGKWCMQVVGKVEMGLKVKSSEVTEGLLKVHDKVLVCGAHTVGHKVYLLASG